MSKKPAKPEPPAAQRMAETGKKGLDLTAAGYNADSVPFCDDTQQVKMKDRGMIGQNVYEAGAVLAEVRLATGVTLSQFCAAIRQGKAGE